MTYKDKVVVITGGASGIGKCAAVELVNLGAKVFVLDIEDKATATASMKESLGDLANNLSFVNCDVRLKSSVDEAISFVFKEASDVDILINSAAVLLDGLIHKISEENWDAVIDTNLKGTFLVVQAVSKFWIASAKQKDVENLNDYPDKRIINISSIAANGNIGQIAYSSSKAGLYGLTNTCAQELIRYNIRTHMIMPTLIETPMIAGLLEKDDGKWRDFYDKRIPFGIGQPEDVTSVIRFLSSEESKFMNGAILEINGGKLKFL